jgi:hypothetical protein
MKLEGDLILMRFSVFAYAANPVREISFLIAKYFHLKVDAVNNPVGKHYRSP